MLGQGRCPVNKFDGCHRVHRRILRESARIVVEMNAVTWTLGFGGWLGILWTLHCIYTDQRRHPALMLSAPILGGFGMSLAHQLGVYILQLSARIFVSMLHTHVILSILGAILVGFIVLAATTLSTMKLRPTPAEVAAAETEEHAADDEHVPLPSSPPPPPAEDIHEADYDHIDAETLNTSDEHSESSTTDLDRVSTPSEIEDSRAVSPVPAHTDAPQ